MNAVHNNLPEDMYTVHKGYECRTKDWYAKKKDIPPRHFRRALLDAGVELARDGEPSVVVLREATRRAGGDPNAAYQHSSSHNDLL